MVLVKQFRFKENLAELSVEAARHQFLELLLVYLIVVHDQFVPFFLIELHLQLLELGHQFLLEHQ